MDVLKEKIYKLPQLNELANKIRSHQMIHLAGVTGSFRAFILSFLLEKTERTALYIANGLESAEGLRDDLELILGNNKVAFLPAIKFEPYDPHDPNPAVLSMRMEALQMFIAADRWVAVATIEGIAEHFPAPEQFLDKQLFLHVGQKISFNTLIVHLHEIGLERAELVERVGQFSVRGGLIDLFAWNYEEPLRLEFFGDAIDSIRQFDVISQRSTEKINEITILPNLFNKEQKALISDIVPDTTLIFCEDQQTARQKLESYFEQARLIFNHNKQDDIQDLPPEKLYLSPAGYDEFLQKRVVLDTSLVKPAQIHHIDFDSRPHPDFNGSIKIFLQYLRKAASRKDSFQTFLQGANQTQSDRLREIIDDEEIPFNGKHLVGTLHSGFILPALHLEILTDHEIFNRFKRRQAYRKFKNGEYLRQLSSLNLYDFVVHIDYGIGQYLGMQTLEFGEVKKECVKIGYADGDYLFVTVDRLNRLQKFNSEEGGAPKLTKLGTTEWERTKQKTKESLKKVAAELIRIYAARKAQQGHHFSSDNHWQKELEASFMYEETDDQLKSISEVKSDMESEKPMDRLLCGDVGFGKTEVALRAAFKAIMDGKQAALLVPTTILAFQHHETFTERLQEFPVRLDMLNRFRTSREQKRILTDLADGKIDLIIGTHRLLSGDVTFKDLGLLVIDEEQRFGVKQKEKLKKYRLSVDILSMTATPIPRTLHMALMGARDFSNIDTPPRNRLPVHTEIIHWDDELLFNIITREMSRGGQVYFVHNRVETIQGVKETLAQLVPHAKIAVGHGQLPERQLEHVMLDFMHKKYDVLLATMIIENGLDIPNVNTIIINRADKFGLAQLYQLRGRVGRSSEQAYAYLLVPSLDKITEIARKRLRTILDFTDLGSGYKIALRDLEIRGAGNLLGREQSGFVQAVGFDMYCKILDEAVNELKQGLPEGQRPADMYELDRKYTDPKIDVDFDLLIPPDYVSSELERITIYHRLVNFTSTEQIEAMENELTDRFGQLPEEVRLFLFTIEIKVLAGRLYAKRLIIKDSHLKLTFAEDAQNDDMFFKEIIPTIMNQKVASAHFLNQKELGVEFKLNSPSRLDRLGLAKKVLHTIVGNV